MANDKKISGLTTLTTPVDADSLVMVDDSATETKKITVANFYKTDTIAERTAAAGVTIDSVLLKDGSVGATGTKVTKGWFTDLESTNPIAADITGDSATCSGLAATAANLSGTPALPDGTTATTQSASDNSTKLATTAYADASGGGALATETVYGRSKLSVAAASADAPIAVGDNDTRVPTQDENNALVGNSGTVVSTSNKLVDAADVASAKTASKIARRDANSDILVATTPTAGDASTSKTYVDSLTGNGITASDVLRLSSDAEVTTVSGEYTKVKTITINRTGVARIKFDFKSSGTFTMYAKIYINGVAVGTERTDDTDTYETYSEDLSVSVGDEVQLYLKSVGSPNNAYGKNFRVYGDSAYYGYGLAR